MAEDNRPPISPAISPTISPTISPPISMEEFRFMAGRAGLGMDQAELDHLKPIYELYLQYTAQMHSIEFGPEEMVVEFHPD
ncbi:MAG: hypothetical protein O3A93_03355 [Chloroflexi bacterium]|nr:hypothetical protein [Chloroflexota bacterium]MDA1270288.1 hypothetical protein [Chloroflexota bacterium]